MPTVYICAQDRGHVPQLASGSVTPRPEAGEAERLLVLVNAPAVGDRRELSAADLDALQDRTFAHLQRVGLRVAPAVPSVRTGPAEWERLFPASGGALYGAANHSLTASLQRAGATTAIPGLFLAGGTVHPGAGVPMAGLSGLLAAEAVTNQLGMPASARCG